MDYQYRCTARTVFNPCVIEYSIESDLFIVGSYELVEKDSELAGKYSDLEQRNNRLGTLELFDGTTDDGNLSIYVHECDFGGVFDLRLVQTHDLSLPENVQLIVVAHANGVLALYRLFQRQITLLKHWKTSSGMLTTVQDCTLDDRANLSFISGGATGVMSQISCRLPDLTVNLSIEDLPKLFDDNEMIEDSITEHQHPIWFIKTYHLRHSSQDDNLVFIGSEDSKWRVFSQRSTCKLYENCDAISGITSFEFFLLPSINEMPDKDNSLITVLVGSYDEYLRIYQLTYSWTNVDDQVSLSIEPSPRLMYKIHIEGGGIWRMQLFPQLHQSNHQSSLLFLSAMYSGIFLLSFDKEDIVAIDGGEGEVKYNLSKCRNKCSNVQQLTLPLTEQDGDKDRLIYGVATSRDLSTVLFASFYDKELYRFCSNSPET